MVSHMQFLEFLSLYKNVDYHMQFLQFLSLLQKLGPSYAISAISLSSLITWSLISIFWSLSYEISVISLPFSKNVDYHMHFLEFLSILQKRGLSYAIYEISFPSPKTWSLICNFRNLFPFSRNVVSHMQFLEFLSLLEKSGLE